MSGMRLRGVEFNENAALKTKRGELIFLAVQMDLRLSVPKLLLIDTIVPEVVLTDLRVFDKVR